jgi:hypothetical protein
MVLCYFHSEVAADVSRPEAEASVTHIHFGAIAIALSGVLQHGS